LVFSYWFDKPQFLIEGRLNTVLIIPSSWGSQLGGYLPASSTFSGAIAGEKEHFYKGSFARTSFTLFIILLYFIFACIFLSKTHKKLVSY
jgi:hypothetical protein